jgi:hypothetical protein
MIALLKSWGVRNSKHASPLVPDAPGCTQIDEPDAGPSVFSYSEAWPLQLRSSRGAVMAENKTKKTNASVDSYLAAIKDEERRQDCAALTELMAKASKHPPVMWGSSIVGFGSYHYRYESGREGDICLVGFSSRKGDITFYGLGSAPGLKELIGKLGKHRAGKGCLYIRKLSDVDLKVLEKLVTAAALEKKQQR